MPKDWTTILSETVALDLPLGDTIEVVLKIRGEDLDQLDRAVTFLHEAWRAAELRRHDEADDPASTREETLRRIDQRVSELREQAGLLSRAN